MVNEFHLIISQLYAEMPEAKSCALLNYFIPNLQSSARS